MDESVYNDNKPTTDLPGSSLTGCDIVQCAVTGSIRFAAVPPDGGVVAPPAGGNP